MLNYNIELQVDKEFLLKQWKTKKILCKANHSNIRNILLVYILFQCFWLLTLKLSWCLWLLIILFYFFVFIC